LLDSHTGECSLTVTMFSAEAAPTHNVILHSGAERRIAV